MFGLVAVLMVGIALLVIALASFPATATLAALFWAPYRARFQLWLCVSGLASRSLCFVAVVVISYAVRVRVRA